MFIKIQKPKSVSNNYDCFEYLIDISQVLRIEKFSDYTVHITLKSGEVYYDQKYEFKTLEEQLLKKELNHGR